MAKKSNSQPIKERYIFSENDHISVLYPDFMREFGDGVLLARKTVSALKAPPTESLGYLDI